MRRPRISSIRAKAGQNPAILAIVAEGFLSRLSFGVVTVALMLYAVQELDMNPAAIGVLITLNTIIAIALKPTLGSAADRFGLKRMLVIAVVLRSAVTILYAFAYAPWMLFAARSVHGVSIAMRDPAISALIAEAGGKKSIAQSFAWYQTAKSFAGKWGNAAAPALLALSGGSFQLVFLVAFALSAFPLYVVLRYVQEVDLDEPHVTAVQALRTPTLLDDESDALKKTRKEGPKLQRSAVASFVGLGFLISATAYAIGSWFPIIATEYIGLSNLQLAIILAIAAFVPLTGPAFGWLADNSGAKLVISLRSVGNICSSALYLLVPNFGGVLAGRVFDDMGKAAFKPAWGAMGAHLSSFDRKRRARTMGYLSSGEDAGEIVGSLAAGAVLYGWGLTILLLGRIALAAITEVYTFIVVRKFLSPEKRAADRLPRRRTRPVFAATSVVAVVIIGLAGAVALRQNNNSRSDKKDSGAQRAVPAEESTPGRGGTATPAGRGARPSGGRCSTNPTIRAIREKTGGC